jgi:hypothetical protein
MAIIICSNCGFSFSSHAKKCPRCKTNTILPVATKTKSIGIHKTLMLFTIVVAIFIVYKVGSQIYLEYKQTGSSSQKKEATQTHQLTHKYSRVDQSTGTSALLTLSNDQSFTQAATTLSMTNTISGRGSWVYENGIIVFTNESGITYSGSAIVSTFQNKITITLNNGIRYIQDDEMYYIKNQISTP